MVLFCAKRLFVGLLALVLSASGCHSLRAQEKPGDSTSSDRPAQPETQQQAIRAVAEEVLLDTVVRDRRGRTVRDLKREDLEVYEDGVKQALTGFRMVEGEAPTLPQAPEAPAENRLVRPPDFLRHINLVTLVFERLGNESRQLARQAALDFLATELRQNVLVAVFTIDLRLYILQQYTNDQKLLRQAIDRATLSNYSEFPSLSNQITEELEEVASSTSSGNAAAASIGRGTGTPATMGSTLGEGAFARMTLDILQYSEAMSRDQQSRSSIFSLLALVKEQQRLPGRKTVIYFSEGLHVPPGMVQFLRATISEANRSNVSVYSVDARGLLTKAATESTRRALSETAAVSRGQIFSAQRRATTREEVMLAESTEATLREDTQGTMADLAVSTGGFLIANSNDLRVGMHRVTEDINSYYELAYRPTRGEYDGGFRRITVKVLRPGVTVQARSGYYAVPPTPGFSLLPSEMPMFAALSSHPLSRDFDFRTIALHFGQNGEGVQYALILEVPLTNVTFALDKKTKLFRSRVSLLALVKNSEGRVIKKFGHTYPLEGPVDKMEGYRKQSLSFSRNFRLAPGRYTVETVALDRESNKTSARRAVLMVSPASSSVAMSSVAIVRRVEELPPGEAEADDPFQFQTLRITPALTETVHPQAGAQLSLYFVVYPFSPSQEKPEAEVQFLRDGEVVGRSPLQLPAADAQGRISYVGTLPVENLNPGDYEIRAVVRQGPSSAEEHAFFKVNP